MCLKHYSVKGIRRIEQTAKNVHNPKRLHEISLRALIASYHCQNLCHLAPVTFPTSSPPLTTPPGVEPLSQRCLLHMPLPQGLGTCYSPSPAHCCTLILFFIQSLPKCLLLRERPILSHLYTKADSVTLAPALCHSEIRQYITLVGDSPLPLLAYLLRQASILFRATPSAPKYCLP